jgi:hypothetical protein
MAQKLERFFIFSWKELLVLILLIVVGSGFLFTLGLHYGKRMVGGAPHADVHESPALESHQEGVPDKSILEEASRHALVATEETLTEATRDAVKSAKLKLDVPRQVDLPKTTKAEKSVVDGLKAAGPAPSESGEYSVQVGSFPILSEALARKVVLEKRGLSVQIRTVKISGKPRYRVLVPGFESFKSATAQAEVWKKEKKVDAFVVIKSER